MMESLIYRAAAAGAFGASFIYPGGGVYDAGFIFLAGQPCPEYLQKLSAAWANRMFVCLSDAWETAVKEAYPDIYSLTRYQMHPAVLDRTALTGFVQAVAPPLKLSSFDRDAFLQKPFSHSANYASFEEFQRFGSGAVVRDGDLIVSAASSYLSFENEVELDISTLPAYRRKGLGLAVAAAMLLEADEKGQTVHWDAQNLSSKALAEKLGYVTAEAYTAYTFLPPAVWS